MPLIEATKIIIPEGRHRRKFEKGPLEDLASGITSKGLLHAPVLRNDGATLLAGERRLRAVLHIYESGGTFTYNGDPVPAGHIPYTLAGELSPLELEEAELEENILREGLTYQEEAAARARLHKLRSEQKAAKGEKQTILDTVNELIEHTQSPLHQGTLSDDLIIAEHLDDPDVAAAPSRKEALKVIRRKATAARNAELAGQFSSLESPHKIVNGDCLDWLQGCMAETFDVVCTDPPYGVGADEFGSQAGARHEYKDDADSFLDLMNKLWPQLARVTKSRAHVYMFCDFRWFSALSDYAKASGFDPWPRPLIWSKSNGMVPKPDFGPRNTYECILFANKGNKNVTGVFSDVLNISSLAAPRFGAEKPAALFRELLRRSVVPADKVLDPFAGACPIIPAANSLSVSAVALELIKEKADFGLTRLEEQIED